MTNVSIKLTDNHLLVGDSSNVAADVGMSGDVTIDDTGATLIKTNVALAGSPTTTTQSSGDNSTNIATTAYVDTAVSAITAGLDSRPSCRVATTAALTATYSNGSSGVGATLTNSGTKSAISIDGVALSANDRVLVKNQATAAQNGIYTVTTVGSGSVNWVLTRATDFNTASGTGVVEGAFTVIEEGTTQFGTFWIETGAGPFTIGTTAITFTQLQVTNVTDAGIVFSDITTNNVSSTKHGFAPKSPADATQFLNGAATPAYAQVKDSDLSTSDVTTNNASTSKHGFLKKLDNNAGHYMDGTGAWSTPAGTLPAATTHQYLTSGSGATYTTPANCRAIHVEMVGGGGAGNGGNAGGDTIFNSVHASGGSAGASGGAGGAGGSGGTGSATARVPGTGGGAGATTGAGGIAFGGAGGGSHFGGGANGTNNASGSAGGTNTGGGGSGSSSTSGGGHGGGGGGSGEYVIIDITSPSSTYTYTIGAGGTSGNAGGSGLIIVTEYY